MFRPIKNNPNKYTNGLKRIQWAYGHGTAHLYRLGKRQTDVLHLNKDRVLSDV